MFLLFYNYTMGYCLVYTKYGVCTKTTSGSEISYTLENP